MTRAREVIANVIDRAINDNGDPADPDKILADLAAAGLVIVPKEPSEGMIEAAHKKHLESGGIIEAGYEWGEHCWEPAGLKQNGPAILYRAMLLQAEKEGA